MKVILRLLLSVALSCTCNVFAKGEDFNATAADAYLQQVISNMQMQPSQVAMQGMLHNLHRLQDQATDCAENSAKQLNAIADLERDIDLSSVTNTLDLQYIQIKKQQQKEQLASCKLFDFKAIDIIQDVKDNLNSLSNINVFAKELPIWEVFNNPQQNYTEILHISFLTVVTLLTAGFLWFLPRLKLVGGYGLHKHTSFLYRATIILAVLLVIGLSLIGFRHLVIFICQGVLLTIGTLILFVSLVYLGNLVLDQDKIHNSIMLGRKYNFIEFKLFKFSLYALLAVWLILTLLEWWGVSLAVLDNFRNLLIDGGTIYGLKIIPLRLIIALMAFSVIQMAWKYALLYMSKVHKFDIDGDAQVVITSLLSYIVLALAILCGLIVSGVNFTGLAIVAGALSVGIGLGLQNVVNNFVSGIILLIEKPIKPGDRVMIKGQEGFVKKISFRYTRIVTPLKEDVIFPNSDLISSPIINYVFNDKLAKIKCTVAVAYGTNVDLVKETLLNVALQHKNVLRDPLNQSMVYLREFGESNMIFDLYCVVHDVNEKYAIASDLNSMIVKAFAANNIQMSYPQLDVHMDR